MTRPPDDLPPDLDVGTLERLVLGQNSAEETARIERWVAEEPRRRLALQALTRVISRTRSTRDRDAAWNRVAAQTEMTAPTPSRPVIAPITGKQMRWPILVAAAFGCFLVAVNLGTGVRYWLQRARTPAPHEYVTATGQRLLVTLVDGTQVTLGPASRLDVPAEYGYTTRATALQGKAYFHVVHNVTHPFAVHVPGGMATDVGTAFVVEAYAEDSATRVAVAEGSVAFETTGCRDVAACGIQLFHGDVAMLAGGRIVQRHTNDVEGFGAWTQGGFSFDETPLRTVVHEVSRTFGVEITIADSTLFNRRITVTLSNEPLDVVLDAITEVVGARFERTAHGVVIRRGPKRPPVVPTSSPRPLTTARIADGHK